MISIAQWALTLALSASFGLAAQDIWEQRFQVATQLAYQGRYEAAEETLFKVLAEAERLGPEDRVAATLNLLGHVLLERGQYLEAEKCLRRSVQICERQPAVNKYLLSEALNNFGGLCGAIGRLGKAEALYRRSLKLKKELLGASHQEVLGVINNLGVLCLRRGKYAEAEQLLRQVLSQIDEGDPALHATNNLALIFLKTGRPAEAILQSIRSLDLVTRQYGPEHPYLATIFDNLASIHYEQKKYPQADTFGRKAIDIAEKALGSEHPTTTAIVLNYARILRKVGRKSEAKRLEKRGKAVQRQHARDNLLDHTIDLSEVQHPR